MTENIVSGKKYRILTDAAQDIWDRVSMWHKAEDVYFDDSSSMEDNKPFNTLMREKAYVVGAVVFARSAPSWVLLRCTTAGTTAQTEPSAYAAISAVGTLITDGTAKFMVYDIRPATTASNSAYQIPAMSLVNSVDGQLSANGNHFYFDYHDGKYGYNTDPARGSSTFVAF